MQNQSLLESNALYTSESELWQSRVQMLLDDGRAPLEFTYLELSRIWGISKNGAYVKTNDWANKFPTIVRVIRGEQLRDPALVHFDFNVSEPTQLPENTSVETVEVATDALEAVGDEAVKAADAYGELKESADKITEVSRPYFISEKVYTQVVTRLEAIGLDYDTIEWERVQVAPRVFKWDADKQSGHLRITLRSEEGSVVAIGIFQSGWLINNLAFPGK